MLVSWILPKNKRKNSTYSTMIPKVDLFLFVFWKNWRHQIVLSKLTDIQISVKKCKTFDSYFYFYLVRASFWRKGGNFCWRNKFDFYFSSKEFVEIPDYKIVALWKIQIAKAKKKLIKHKFKFFLLTLTRISLVLEYISATI